MPVHVPVPIHIPVHSRARAHAVHPCVHSRAGMYCCAFAGNGEGTMKVLNASFTAERIVIQSVAECCEGEGSFLFRTVKDTDPTPAPPLEGRGAATALSAGWEWLPPCPPGGSGYRLVCGVYATEVCGVYATEVCGVYAAELCGGHFFIFHLHFSFLISHFSFKNASFLIPHFSFLI